MLKILSRFLEKSKGTTAIEYALIASLIAVVAISGMKLIGNAIGNKFNTISSTIEDATTGTGT